MRDVVATVAASPRRRFRRLAIGAAVVAVAFAIVFAAILTRLWFGPIALDRYISVVEQRLEQRLPEDLSVELGGLELGWPRSAGLTLVGDGLSVSTADGEPLGSVETVRLGLKTWPLLAGRIAVARVTLLAPDIDGAALHGWMPDTDRSMLEGVIGGLGLVALLGPDVPEIEVSGAKVTSPTDGRVVDLSTIRALLTTEDGAAVLRVDDDSGAALSLALTIVPETDGGYTADVTVVDMALDDLSIDEQIFSWLPAFSGPMSGAATVRVGPRDRLIDAEINLKVGGGYLEIVPGTGFLLESATLSARWDDAARSFRIAPSEIVAGTNRAVLWGAVGYPSRDSINFGIMPIELEIADLALAASPDVRPVEIDRVTLRALYVPGRDYLQVDRLDVASEEAAMSVVGAMSLEGGVPAVRARGSMASMSIDVLTRLWPETLATSTYDWVKENVHGGMIEFVDVLLDIPPGTLRADAPLPENAMRLQFMIRDLDMSFFGEVPPLTGASARARMSLDTFSLELEDPGEIQIADRGAIAVESAGIEITGLRQPAQDGHLTMVVSGDAHSVMGLTTYYPLNRTSAGALATDEAEGSARVVVDAKLPMLREIPLAATDLDVLLELRDFASEAGFGGGPVTDGQIDLTVTETSITAIGDAMINGVDAQIEFTEPLMGGDDGSNLVLLTLDEKGRSQFGLELASLISGPVDVAVSQTEDAQAVRADLTAAGLSYPEIGLQKPAGEPAEATFEVGQDGDRTTIGDLEVTGRGIDIVGDIVLDTEGRILLASFPTFALHAGDDVQADVERIENGALRVQVEGRRLDARQLIRSLFDIASADSGAGDEPTDLLIRAEIDEARGFNDQVLSDVRVDADRRDGHLRTLTVSGRFEDGATVTANIAPDGAGTPRLRVNSNNGGRLLRWLDIYTNVQGGALALTAGLPEGADSASGNLTLSNFRITDDPGLERLIASGEAATAIRQTQRADPTLVQFTTLAVEFERRQSQLRVRDGVLRGNAIGATFDGAIDLRRETVAVAGTYVPLYALNNVFGRLPVIGPILGGGVDEGLLGITYRLSGPLEDPALSVNPLSAMTPGMFRHIFGFATPEDIPGFDDDRAAPPDVGLER